jgi:hypothetical protein
VLIIPVVSKDIQSFSTSFSTRLAGHTCWARRGRISLNAPATFGCVRDISFVPRAPPADALVRWGAILRAVNVATATGRSRNNLSSENDPWCFRGVARGGSQLKALVASYRVFASPTPMYTLKLKGQVQYPGVTDVHRTKNSIYLRARYPTPQYRLAFSRL